MKHIKNAFDYHQELGELKVIIDSIENTLAYIDNAFEQVNDETPDIFHMCLSMAQADLRKSHARLQKRYDEIINKLSGSYF